MRQKFTDREPARIIPIGSLVIGTGFTVCSKGIKTTQALQCGHSVTKRTDTKIKTIAIKSLKSIRTFLFIMRACAVQEDGHMMLCRRCILGFILLKGLQEARDCLRNFTQSRILCVNMRMQWGLVQASLRPMLKPF